MIYDIFIAPFSEDAMRRSLLGVIGLALGGAPVGVFLMLRRMSLMGDAMSHAILPGVAIGFLLSSLNRLAMTLGGLIAGLVVAVLSGIVTRTTEMKEDASLAVFFLVSLALGVEPAGLSTSEFRSFLINEGARYARISKDRNITSVPE